MSPGRLIFVINTTRARGIWIPSLTVFLSNILIVWRSWTYECRALMSLGQKAFLKVNHYIILAVVCLCYILWFKYIALKDCDKNCLPWSVIKIYYNHFFLIDLVTLVALISRMTTTIVHEKSLSIKAKGYFLPFISVMGYFISIFIFGKSYLSFTW